MSKDLKSNEFWLKVDGKIVSVKGKKYKIKVSTYRAIYPYERMVITVYAEMIDKNDPEYLKVKHDLGGDWSTDVLDSGDDFYASVYAQCFMKPAKVKKN